MVSFGRFDSRYGSSADVLVGVTRRDGAAAPVFGQIQWCICHWRSLRGVEGGRRKWRRRWRGRNLRLEPFMFRDRDIRILSFSFNCNTFFISPSLSFSFFLSLFLSLSFSPLSLLKQITIPEDQTSARKGLHHSPINTS